MKARLVRKRLPFLLAALAFALSIVPAIAHAGNEDPALQMGGMSSDLQTQNTSDLQFMGLSGGCVKGTAETGYTVYVRDGGEVTVTLAVKNNAGKNLEYVSMIDAPAYLDNGNGLRPIDYDQNDDAFNPIIFPPYKSDEPVATNATDIGGRFYTSETKFSRRPGYLIEPGATATFRMKINSGDLHEGTYDWNIKLGSVRYDLEWQLVVEDPTLSYWDQVFIERVVEDVYSESIPIHVVVYSQDAALTVGTGTTINLAQLPSEGIDFGTINLATAGEDELAGSRDILAVNGAAPNSSTVDGNGNSTSIKVAFGGENILDGVSKWDGAFRFSNGRLHDTNWAPLSPPTSDGNTTSAEYAEYTVEYNATSLIAGTYTGNLIISTIPHKVRINNAESNSAGVYRIPVKLKLEGTNPRLLPRATGLSAAPGNGLVELAWTPAEGADENTEYTVYRRVGVETQANPDLIDWSKYEAIGTKVVGMLDGDGTVLFVDGEAENGTTYTYTVMVGDPHRGYASATVSATPDTSIASLLMAPVASSYGVLNGVEVSWYMNEKYGGSSFDGAGVVDHFNIYRNGVLVDQVYQSAVNDSYDSYYDRHSYEWVVNEPVAELYTPYTWSVSAVSKSGVEGYRAICDPAAGEGENSLILSHQAWFDPDCYVERLDDYVPAILISVDTYSNGDNVDTLTFWREEGTRAPSTSDELYATCDKNYMYSWDRHDFEDTGVEPGKTYTYAVQGTDFEGRKTNVYTFTVKAAEGETYKTPDVTWSVVGKTKARLTWNGDYYYDNGDLRYTGTYQVYRNDSLIQTVSNQESYDILDDPNADGTYVYRVDRVISGDPGFSIRGREFTFVRNTQPEDTSSLLKPPDAPTLTARTATGTRNVILSWTPAATGGAPEGYHIYRKDAGQPVIGKYYTWNGWTNWPVLWGMNRYLTIKDSETHSLIDGYTGYYKDNLELGALTGLGWDNDDLPHEYYITAYNRAGESAPSQVVTFDTHGDDGHGNTIAPANPAEDPPAAPTISKVWVEWEDYSSYQNGFDDWVYGDIHVAWEDSGLGGAIDRWKATFANTHVEHGGDNPPETKTLDFYQAVLDPAAKLGMSDNSPTASVGGFSVSDDGDLGRTVAVTVAAENGAGSTASNSAQIVVRSLPRFYALAGNGSAMLRWTDLVQGEQVQGEQVQVTSWEIWRKAEYGVWERVAQAGDPDLPNPGSYSGVGKDSSRHDVNYYEWTDPILDNGWAYQYKVVAKCDDGVDRPSVVREVTPERTAAVQAPGAPRNLRAQVVNGEVLFSWDEPEAGGVPQYYQVMKYYEASWGSGWESAGSSVSGDSLCSQWATSTPGTYKFFVCSYSYIDGQRSPAWGDYNASFAEQYPTASNVIEVSLTQAQIDQRVYSYPSAPELTVTPDDGQIKLAWQACDGATYYTVDRENNDYPDIPDVTIAVNPEQSTYTFVDTEAQPGVRYRYIVTACNDYRETYNYIYATASGTTRDQLAAKRVQDLILSESCPTVEQVNDQQATNEQIQVFDEQVAAVQEAYDSLTAKQKGLVSDEAKDKLANVTAALLTRKYTAIVKPTADLIDALPTPAEIEGADKELLEGTYAIQIAQARTSYNGIVPAEAKQAVDTTKLVQAEQALAVARKKQADKAEALRVTTIINALPPVTSQSETPLALSDRDVVAAARNAYNALTDSQRAYVLPATVTGLVAREARLIELQKIEDDKAAAAQVDAIIVKLPAVEQLELNHANDVADARAAYNALTEDQKAYVLNENLEKLRACETRMEELIVPIIRDVEFVEGLIAEIDDEVTLDSEQRIVWARNAYEALLPAGKDMVKNYDKLTQAEADLKDVKTAAALANAVDIEIGLIGEVTLDRKGYIEGVRADYEGLTARAKQMVAKLSVLVDAEATIAALEVDAEIDALGTIDPQNEAAVQAAVQAARAHYSGLSALAKSKVSKLSALIDAEDTVEARKVEALIAAIGSVTLESEDAITVAQAAYDNLRQAAQRKVGNYSVLRQAQTSLNTLKAAAETADRAQADNVSALILALPEVGKLTLNDQGRVTAASNEYNALTAVQKAYVDAQLVQRLNDSKKRIDTLKAAQNKQNANTKPANARPANNPKPTSAPSVANPISAKAKSKQLKVKAAKVKKKKQTIKAAKAYNIAGAVGTVTFSKVKGNKKITVNPDGSIVLKKGLKKGTFTVQVLVTASGDATYLPGSALVKLKIRVK